MKSQQFKLIAERDISSKGRGIPRPLLLDVQSLTAPVYLRWNSGEEKLYLKFMWSV